MYSSMASPEDNALPFKACKNFKHSTVTIVVWICPGIKMTDNLGV